MEFLQPEWHNKLSSTNTVLLEWLKNGKEIPSGFVLAALEQTAGHGRNKHHWISRAGEDLTFSFLLSTQQAPSELASLSLAVALGIASALDIFGVTAQTRWPNDLLVRGRKICGILSQQSKVSYADGSALVVGIGINVNMDETMAASLKKPATSLLIETGKKYTIKEVLDIVLEVLPHWIDRWEGGGFSAIRDDWITRCCYIGEHITIGEGKELKSGVLEGFGDKGQLILRDDDGFVCDVWAGDIE